MKDDETIWKARVSIGGRMTTTDVVQHEGKLWLVLWWLEHTQEGVSIPGRAVRMDSMEHIPLRGVLAQEEQADFVVNDTLPGFLRDDAPLPPQAAQFEVLEKPDIRRRLPSIH
jgi:hypothetical protein